MWITHSSEHEEVEQIVFSYNSRFNNFFARVLVYAYSTPLLPVPCWRKYVHILTKLRPPGCGSHICALGAIGACGCTAKTIVTCWSKMWSHTDLPPWSPSGASTGVFGNKFWLAVSGFQLRLKYLVTTSIWSRRPQASDKYGIFHAFYFLITIIVDLNM